MIDWHVGSHANDRLERMGPRLNPDFIADAMPGHCELEQRRIADECPARLQPCEPPAVIEPWAGVDEGPHQPRWPAQTREVRKRVGPRSGRDPESTVQQPVPDLGSDEMVRVAHHLDV